MSAMTAKPKTQAEGRHLRNRHNMSLIAEGEPMVWMTGGMLGVALLMIAMMLGYVILMGAGNFWPRPIMQITTATDHVFVGEVTRDNSFKPTAAVIDALPAHRRQQTRDALDENDGYSERRLIRTGNFDLTGTRFHWVPDFMVREEVLPDWAMVMERMEWGHFYGFPKAFLEDGQIVAETPQTVWEQYRKRHPEVRQRWRQRQRLATIDIGRTNRRQEIARQKYVKSRQAFESGSIGMDDFGAQQAAYSNVVAEVAIEHARITEEMRLLTEESNRFAMLMTLSDGREKSIHLADVVRAYPANRLSLAQKLGVYFSRWREFIFDDPREANTEGGVFPAIVGTVTMTLVMTLFVVPFGVLAALYLREYAKSGPLVSAIRIAINNLAGVPSIVFGVFGLGFFCYIIGGGIDELFYSAAGGPVYRKGGVLWASLTLALLTLPVVIVATEEALAAVPGSMREGSYACGASKWQTIKRIVLPRAMPGIMTGTILAMARGAGEVAPLMLVGAVKLAPDLPVDIWNWSGSLGFIPTGFVHLERSFMHLGFHIYDVGFQSPDSEAARPMVFTTTLLLIGIVVALNVGAMVLRNRLRRKFMTGAF